jgi:cytochrome c biogenesis protein CcdA
LTSAVFRTRSDSREGLVALLSTILGLALLDSLNPTSITASCYLAITGRTTALEIFVAAVYTTYLAFALTLLWVLGAAARRVLAGTPTSVTAGMQIAAGVLLLMMGVWTWRRRGRLPRHRELGAGSAVALGVMATVLDLPTAVPLIAAAGLILAAALNTLTQLGLLAIYDLVYVAPLLVILLLRRRLGTACSPAVFKVMGRLGRLTPALSSGMRIGIGCMLGGHGIIALA